MANFKKKNPETGQWETWASGSASGIYSVNPKLLKDADQEYISVEEALQRDREDIELMQKNISWLALHGGGGSGFGGGSDATNSIEFVYNGNVVDAITVTSTRFTIGYRLLSSRNSTRFTVVLSLDGRQVQTLTGLQPSSTTVRSFTIPNIQAYNEGPSHTFQIEATDATGQVVIARCTLTELSVTLTGPVSGARVNLIDIASSNLTLNYKATDIGIYNLFFSTNSRIGNDLSLAEGSIDINVTNTRNNDIYIPYTSIFSNTSSLVTGRQYNYYFVLVSAADTSVRSAVFACPITITSPNNVSVANISLSSDVLNPTVVSKNSVLYNNFIAYLESTSAIYKYSVYAEELEHIEEGETEEDKWVVTGEKFYIVTNGSGIYGNTTTVQYNEFPSSTWFKANSVYRLTTIVTDTNDPSKQGTLYTYIFVSESTSEKIPLNADDAKIFDFYVFGFEGGASVNNWVSKN